MAGLFINIHSHTAPSPNEWVIQNLYSHWEKADMPGCFSIGIHPWHIEEGWEEQLLKMKQQVSHPHVIAIGECGLDKACKTEFSLQQLLFAEQIALANTVQKPLIIHCVRAWDEVLSMLKSAAKVKVIFHGFNKNAELARRIISAGFYISLGKALSEQRIKEVLRHIPASHFFLETDDDNIPIENIYKEAAEALSIDHNSLSLQLQNNALAVFGAAAVIP